MPRTKPTRTAGNQGATAPSPLVVASIPLQNISWAGPLTHIYVSDDLSSQIAHISDSTYEFYPPNVAPGDSGTFLVVDGALYAPNFVSHGVSATGDLGSDTY